MARLGVEAGDVADVVLTHMHYDHVGNFHKFPNSRFHLQEREMHYATGHHMRYHAFARSFEVEDVVGLVRLNFKGRLELHRGDVELAPGVTLHFTGGHTAGLQVVRVHTQRGWVVLASDASHFYEHLKTDRLYTTAFHLGDMLDAFRTLECLADTQDHIIPGHDPLVMRHYPAAAPEHDGIIVRLDVAPRG
jgi:glyoxylase-like metal-dependent hydrolase (beta-lactamase superfamily II)